MTNYMVGYLQHGTAPGPFRTEKVTVMHEHSDRYKVRFEGLWRRVYIETKRLYIMYQGTRIPLQIEGDPV